MTQEANLALCHLQNGSSIKKTRIYYPFLFSQVNISHSCINQTMQHNIKLHDDSKLDDPDAHCLHGNLNVGSERVIQ